MRYGSSFFGEEFFYWGNGRILGYETFGKKGCLCGGYGEFYGVLVIFFW